MGDDRVQHIGDDQLIYGLPKHMEGVANTGANEYWEIVPSKNACRTCKAMGGKRFDRKPVPIHPNCTCEARRVSQKGVRPVPPRQIDSGSLQGYEDWVFKRFSAGQKITVTILNLGPLPAAIWMRVDQTQWGATRYLSMGEAQSVSYSKFGEPPVSWEIFLFYLGGEGSSANYEIYG